MTFNRFGTFVLAVTLAVATAPTVVLPTAAVAAGQECGWATVNGALVFLGTCAGGGGDGQSDGQWTNPCVGKLTGGPVYSYRMELADTGCGGPT